MEKITFLKLDTSDQKGAPLIGKNGKPYTRQTLKVESKGDRYISGFLNDATKGFAIGDEVDIVITEATAVDKQGRPYLNWSLPKKGSLDTEKIDRIYENTETLLNRMVQFQITLETMKDYIVPKKKTVDYPQSTGPTSFDDHISDATMDVMNDPDF